MLFGSILLLFNLFKLNAVVGNAMICSMQTKLVHGMPTYPNSDLMWLLPSHPERLPFKAPWFHLTNKAFALNRCHWWRELSLPQMRLTSAYGVLPYRLFWCLRENMSNRWRFFYVYFYWVPISPILGEFDNVHPQDHPRMLPLARLATWPNLHSLRTDGLVSWCRKFLRSPKPEVLKPVGLHVD